MLSVNLSFLKILGNYIDQQNLNYFKNCKITKLDIFKEKKIMDVYIFSDIETIPKKIIYRVEDELTQKLNLKETNIFSVSSNSKSKPKTSSKN